MDSVFAALSTAVMAIIITIHLYVPNLNAKDECMKHHAERRYLLLSQALQGMSWSETCSDCFAGHQGVAQQDLGKSSS